MTAIERTLFLDEIAHWVEAFDWLPDALVIQLHPCMLPEALVLARFPLPQLVSVDCSHADNELKEFPWEIIGFDSEQVADGRWEFCLFTDQVEYVFVSGWPVVVRPAP